MTTRIAARTIGDVARELGVSVHALRLYERRDLLVAAPQRDAGGRRVYSADDVEWLQTCLYLRGIGMSLADIARYAELARAGEGNEAQRLQLLQAHLARVEEQLAQMRGWADAVARKVAYYEGVVSGTPARCEAPA